MIAKTKFGRPVRAKHYLANEQSLSSSTISRIPSSKSSTSSTRRRTTSTTNKGASVVSARARISSRHFPLQLHDMLNDSEDKGFEDIVSWQPHGRCFVVHRPKDFVEHIMPIYFKQSKFLPSSDSSTCTASAASRKEKIRTDIITIYSSVVCRAHWFHDEDQG